MNTPIRPLSPHLQVYRPQLTSILSILHRASGVFLAMGSILIAWWLWAIMAGGGSYELAFGILNSIFGKLILFGWTLCNFYHLCNGIRHLFWDAGYGLEIEQTYLSGKAMLACTVALTLMVWLI